jgi:hypothetical protein
LITGPFDTSPRVPLVAQSDTTLGSFGTDEITFVGGANEDVRELAVVGDGPGFASAGSE